MHLPKEKGWRLQSKEAPFLHCTPIQLSMSDSSRLLSGRVVVVGKSGMYAKMRYKQCNKFAKENICPLGAERRTVKHLSLTVGMAERGN